MRYLKSQIRAGISLVALSVGCVGAWSEVSLAQEADDGVEDTIVVTGSKRETAFINSDLSVTVLDQVAIDQARLRDFRRIDDLVPNVQFNEFGQQGSIFITVRGVESNPFIVNRAAVYIDGIPFRELNNSVLNQVESVEVLRGPQGTLYGANTESGLIIVNTKAPGDEPEGVLRLTGTSFSEGEGYSVDGSFSGPLIEDRLSGALSFSLGHEDAYVRNLGASNGETGHINESFVQGRLRWTPTERLTVNATAYWLDVDAPGLFDQQYVPLDRDAYDRNYADFFNNGERLGAWEAFEDAPKSTQQRELVAGLSATYELDYGALDFAVSYRDVEEDAAGLDFDLTSSPIVSGREMDSDEYTNAEIRFTSPQGDRFDYIVGASFYQSTEINTKASFLGAGTLDSYIPAPPQEKSSEDVSLFGSANWYVTDQLRLSTGVRYERAHREAIQRPGQLDIGFGDVILYPDAQLSETFEEWLPKFALQYRVTDDFSLHVSASRGYIPGGFNLVAVQQGGLDESVFSYESETLWSQEIGFKWRSADRRFSASGALFHITSDNWQEIQVATDDAGRPISSDFVGSDASIRSQGFEAELNWLPSEAWSIAAHFGYVDAEYTDLQLSETLNVRGQRVQFVPEYDGGLSVRYQWASGIFMRGEAGFTGAMPLRARGDAEQDAVETFGLQFGYEGDRFTARVFGENLTNERRASGLAIENLAFGSDGLFYAPLDAPRILGVELETRF